MEGLEQFLKQTLEVSRFERRTLSLMGCDIVEHDYYSITISQAKMLSELDPQVLIDAIGKEEGTVATLQQSTKYRHVIWKMLLIGQMLSPIILLHASMVESKIADLHSRHLCALSTNLKHLKTHPAELPFHSNPDKGAFSLNIIFDGAMVV